MPPKDLRCPNCRSSRVRWLKNSSQDCLTNYYLCDECSHVWNIDTDAEHTLRNVTPIRRLPSPARR